ncbi:hypothetical protein, partial [Candidatus Avelusimicrobium stercoris]|uniref:hypothetical protein n=1 Tax=Candidatus Avelusimicrobium stercoris TaxID=1947924 RepID=UPI003D14B9A5
MKGFMNTLLSFQGPHTSGNLESRDKMRSFSNQQTGSRIHVRDDNFMKKESHPGYKGQNVVLFSPVFV